MKTQPLVSVIIPTYNRADFLLEAVKSILKQSYNNIEIIIVDDGSNDRSYELIKSGLINSIKKPIRYFYQRNKGVSSARNCGIKEAKGEYISFLDSDDLWDSSKINEQIAFLEGQIKYKICYTNEIWIRNGVRVNQKKAHQKYSGDIYFNCLPLCIISPSSIVLKRDVVYEIGFFDESLSACEDYDYWLRLSQKYPIYFMDKPLITKRGGHKDQLSHKFPVMDSFRIQALLKILNSAILNRDQYLKTVETLLKKCEIVKTGCYKRGKQEEGAYYDSIIQRYS